MITFVSRLWVTKKGENELFVYSLKATDKSIRTNCFRFMFETCCHVEWQFDSGALLMDKFTCWWASLWSVESYSCEVHVERKNTSSQSVALWAVSQWVSELCVITVALLPPAHLAPQNIIEYHFGWSMRKIAFN